MSSEGGKEDALGVEESGRGTAEPWTRQSCIRTPSRRRYLGCHGHASQAAWAGATERYRHHNYTRVQTKKGA